MLYLRIRSSLLTANHGRNSRRFASLLLCGYPVTLAAPHSSPVPVFPPSLLSTTPSPHPKPCLLAGAATGRPRLATTQPPTAPLPPSFPLPAPQGFPSWQVVLVDLRCHGESAARGAYASGVQGVHTVGAGACGARPGEEVR